ncbi:chromate efflux transporter [Geomonas oryzisoli]|uniref:Chromate efflux transporter n=1 Tax=Geomonas oryzisoli TaxID=2847992 RepID=A0ABX8J4R5_9BACT|nr:chromate efflux transporter [Geomonas oryzisoli]QWV93288.1 chromate efflux transporter [Geomonas oryzisoli]
MQENDDIRRVTGKEPTVGLWELVLYFLRLGASGFGGPIALAGYMQRDLIPRGWITEDEYREGLAFSQMMPGPLAAQLAMWIGFIRHGVAGASLVGIVFILPTFLIVIAVSWLYVSYHGLPVVQALFYGMGPTIIAIVALSAYRLARTTVGTDRRLWAIFVMVAIITVVARAEIALLFVATGLVGMLLYSPPGSRLKPRSIMAAVPTLSTGMATPVLLQLGAFFVKAGAFTFGSGLAIVPFLHQGVVLRHHWLTERSWTRLPSASLPRGRSSSPRRLWGSSSLVSGAPWSPPPASFFRCTCAVHGQIHPPKP